MENNSGSGFLLKAIDLVTAQIQSVSAQDLHPIELPDDVSLPPELHRLVANINKLIEEAAREKAAHGAVMQSEKMITLGELVAGTSHELNNPLAIVTGY